MKLGFGSSVPRFGKICTHPDLDPSGVYLVREKACNPCYYRPQSMQKAYENITNRKRKMKNNKDPWRYKSDLEDWCKHLGYRNQKILDQRKWDKTILGPAWTNVPDIRKCEPAACKNVNFGRTPRFKQLKKEFPGPGTYYQAHPYKAPYGPHSTRPTFQREEPCRFKDATGRWSLAPNRYRILDPDSIENKPNKIVSLRGPYDLLTGKRDMSTINNHFKTNYVFSASWPIALPGSFEGYKKKPVGTWNKTGRSCPPRHRTANTDLAMAVRKPSDPSPATYDVHNPPHPFPQNKHGFNSSYDRPPNYIRTIVWPGVGRYNIGKPPICGIAGRGHRHVFLSKIGRTVGAVIQEPMNTF